MSDPIMVRPIGAVSGGRGQIFEDHWGAVVSRLILDPAEVDPDATLGLGEFSHIEVVFHFHKETRVRRGATHPRRNPAWQRVGVLAGHSPVRPNHFGVSRCAAGRRRPGVDGPGAGRHRRHARPRHQAPRDRLRTKDQRAGTGLEARTDGRLLLTNWRTCAGMSCTAALPALTFGSGLAQSFAWEVGDGCGQRRGSGFVRRKVVTAHNDATMRTVADFGEFGTITLDEPVPHGGTGQGPSPLQAVLGALCGCEAVTFHRTAAEVGFGYGSLDFETAFTIDIRGRQGNRSVRPHFQTVRVRAVVATTGPTSALAAVIKETEARCR